MKGSMVDMIYIVVIIFIFAVSIILSYFVLTEFGTQLNATGNMFNTTVAMEIVSGGQAGLRTFDYVFFIITMFLGIGVIILGFNVGSHPIFFVVTLILLVVCLMLGAILSNIFQEIISTSLLTPTANLMTNVTLVMQNLPVIILSISVVLIIVIYSRSRGGQI